MKHNLFKKAALATAGLLMLSMFSAAPAQAGPSQGGPDGQVFLANITDGSIYRGSIDGTQARTVYWHGDGSKVDQVATTKTRVAWSSSDEASTIPVNKVMVGDYNRKATNVISVTMPANTIAVNSLAADANGETIYASVKLSDLDPISGLNMGALVKFQSDGTGLSTIFTDVRISTVVWGLAFDDQSNKLYYCNEGDFANVYSINANGANEQLLYEVENGSCDGIGIDTVSNILYWDDYGNGNILTASAGGGSGTSDYSVLISGEFNPPSAMFINNTLGRIYFTTESDFVSFKNDGTDRQTFYPSGHVEGGYEGMAVNYYPLPTASTPTVTDVTPTHGPEAGGTEITITGTGFVDGATVEINGVACSPVTFVSATEIKCTTGANPAGTYDVTVSNPDLGDASKVGGFTYDPPATGLEADDKDVKNGDTTTFTGTNLEDTWTLGVKIDGSYVEYDEYGAFKYEGQPIAWYGFANWLDNYGFDLCADHTFVFNVFDKAYSDFADSSAAFDYFGSNSAIGSVTVEWNYDPAQYGCVGNTPGAVNPSVDNIELNTATVHWTAPDGDVTGYKIYVGDKLVGTVGADVTSFDLAELLKNTGYTVTVVAYNDAGDGESSSAYFKTDNQLVAKVYFAGDRAKVHHNLRMTIKALAAKVKGGTNFRVDIAGQIRNIGGRHYHFNRKLSKHRAMVVKSLLKTYGVNGVYTLHNTGKPISTLASAKRADVVITYDNPQTQPG